MSAKMAYLELPNLNSKFRLFSLRHFGVLPSLDFLEAEKIDYNVIVQKPGDTVYVDGLSAHWGLNTGVNLAWAINLENHGPLNSGCECESTFGIHIDDLYT